MKIKNICAIILPGALFLGSSPLLAEGIPVEPGLWKMTSTVTMPMLPQPRVTTVTECMEKSEITMDEVGGEGMDPNCTFDTAQVDGNTMKWSVDCPVEGGTSHGEWQATYQPQLRGRAMSPPDPDFEILPELTDLALATVALAMISLNSTSWFLPVM